MLRRLLDSSGEFSPWLLGLLSCVMLGLIAYLDFITGNELHFFLFYAFHISFVSYFLGLRAGLATALLCSLLWWGLNIGPAAMTPIGWWNTLVRLGLYVATALLVGSVRQQQNRHLLEARRFRVNQEQLTRLSYDNELKREALLAQGLGILCSYYELSDGSISRIQGGVIEILAGSGKSETGTRQPLGGSLEAWIYDQEGVTTAADLRRAAPANLSRPVPEMLIGSPYRIGDEPYGVVMVYGLEPADEFSPFEKQFMQIFCQWLSSMLERSHYIENLQKLNLGKDRLLAVVAHDLRNPIGAALTAKRLVDNFLAKDRPAPPEMLAIIERSCHAALNLIEELLEVAALEQEQLKLPLEPLRLSSFITEVVTMQRPRVAEKQLELIWEDQAETARVALNPRKMARVLENLLHNAMKFTPAGGTLTLRLRRSENSAILTLTDTGIGIPPELQAVLFDKFSAARRQGLAGEKSTGLGMFIVQETVQLHGGHISVSSVEEEGTCFTIELPLLPD